mmetsp:Transcript_11341/g.23176  ORF Transcript_11341/g.23176 Transcript_11341/m.23176 type:complete len:227 (-) Transcript_11341:25-705(-)
MSKSRGNVVNPDDIVVGTGADSLRLYEMFMGPLEAVKPWQTEQVSGVVRFQRKLYDVARKCVSGGWPNESESEETTKLLHKTMKKVTEDIENMSFNTAISALMVLTNHISSTTPTKDTMTRVAIMLTPFAPHLGEEIWSMTGGQGSVSMQKWVEWEEALTIDSTVVMGVQINGKVRGEIEMEKDEEDENVALSKAKEVEKVAKFLSDKEIKKVIYKPGRILNIIAK